MSLYRKRFTIALHGELGAGKTTFVQGFAKGLGIDTPVVSPTYALEQQYDDTLSHIDLYRLTPAHATEFLEQTADFPGIRIVEWGRKGGGKADIEIRIEEHAKGVRQIECEFNDIAIPSDKQIDEWEGEIHLPPHIREHMEAVADTCTRLAAVLLSRGTIIRGHALRAAARTHDLLRFLDFQSWEGNADYTPTDENRACWSALREHYPPPHETAAAAFLADRGFPEIGAIVRPHRGYDALANRPLPLQTIEQVVLAYADKRVRFRDVVSLDERFDDFQARYGKGKETDAARAWRAHMKKLESELFPSGTPF